LDYTLPLILQFNPFNVLIGEYDARMRVLIRHVAKLLDVPLELVDLFEESAVDCLTDDQKELTE
jgi:hypothetical protein